MNVSFKAANEESKAIMSLQGIEYREYREGVDVHFPDAVVISSDQGEYNQPSYWCYQVGDYKYVYPLDSEVLCIE